MNKHRTGYKRRVLFRTKAFEIVYTIWPPGAKSLIHGHGKSKGVGVVLEGELEESVYHLGAKEYRYSVTRHKGQVFQEDASRVHQVENKKNKRAVVVYIFLPPLLKMKVYSEEDFKK